MAAITHETVRRIEEAHARGEDFPLTSWEKVQLALGWAGWQERARYKPLCEGGPLYVRGECGDCDLLAPGWLAAPSTGGAETAGWRFDDSRPDADEVVLVVYRTNPRHEHGGKPSIHRARFSGGQWRFIDDAVQERRQDGVVCWMPLPPIPGIHEAPASSAPAQAVETAPLPAQVLDEDDLDALRSTHGFTGDVEEMAREIEGVILDKLRAALQSPAASPAAKEDGKC